MAAIYSTLTIRPDYHRKTKLTYAEAAEIAGVTVKTVQNWASMGFIKRAARVGPFRVGNDELLRFLETGITSVPGARLKTRKKRHAQPQPA